jgi:Asp/Glu/hydantoin racemase
VDRAESDARSLGPARTGPEHRSVHRTPFGAPPKVRQIHVLDDEMIERFLTLARYARRCGADAILFTCSAFAPAIEAAAAALDVPVLKPNEAMLDEALACGARIGIMGTFEPSIPSLRAEVEELARTRNLDVTIKTRVVHGALAALHEGQAAEHDRLIAAGAAEMEDCDALILGQFSMASAAECIPARPGRTVRSRQT